MLDQVVPVVEPIVLETNTSIIDSSTVSPLVPVHVVQEQRMAQNAPEHLTESDQQLATPIEQTFTSFSIPPPVSTCTINKALVIDFSMDFSMEFSMEFSNLDLDFSFPSFEVQPFTSVTHHKHHDQPTISTSYTPQCSEVMGNMDLAGDLSIVPRASHLELMAPREESGDFVLVPLSCQLYAAKWNCVIFKEYSLFNYEDHILVYTWLNNIITYTIITISSTCPLQLRENGELLV